ncbi:MAG: hypothetical protein H7Y31_09490 [Chitinophagaceae bacterium]|nr:hypothetical protein [Chitinophagaceae bacterium]
MQFCTILSLFIANSGWGNNYLDIWHHSIKSHCWFYDFNLSVEQRIDDYFLLIRSVEIEQELHA